MEPVDVVSTISRYKNPNEKGNFSATRRVPLKEKFPLPNKASRVTKGLENSFAKNISRATPSYMKIVQRVRLNMRRR